jgi:monovalent cation:H+ antiporter-2, CPA2 family
MQEGLKVTLTLLATAVVVVILFRRFSLPAILGYLIVGVIIGPHALGFVSDTEEKRHLAEFGVVFLMFSIGLEFSLPQLQAMRRNVFGLGAVIVAAVAAVTFAVAMAAGLPWQAGVVLGGVLAMSSTAIASKMLADSAQLHSTHGRATIGAALFQDLAVVPFLVLVPALARPASELGWALGLALIKAIVVLTILLFVGQRFMRWLFGYVARQKSSELFVLTVLLVTLGLSAVTEMAGLSLALGAFMAGMLISETEYRYQVEDYIKPFKDVLLGLFFVTIGMLLNVHQVLVQWLPVLLTLIALLALKFVICIAVARAFSLDRANAMRVSLALTPVGEFGFVLLSLGGRAGVVPTETLQVVLAASLISMLMAPFIFAKMEKIVLYFNASEWEMRALQLHTLAVKSMQSHRHVIICGYGRSGQSLARFLASEKIQVVALDADPERVRQAAAAGESVVFGDAARREVLTAAGLPRAKAVVVSFADTHAALAILSHVRELRPDLPVIVRTFDDTDVAKLREAGAAEIVAEVVEGSLMLATQTMLLLGSPLNRVLGRHNRERQERYQFMHGFFPGVSDEDDGLDSEHPRMQSIILGPSAAAIGQPLAALNLRALEVQVQAVRHRSGSSVKPTEELVLAESDVVVLLGRPEALAKAEMRLLQG